MDVFAVCLQRRVKQLSVSKYSCTSFRRVVVVSQVFQKAVACRQAVARFSGSKLPADTSQLRTFSALGKYLSPDN